ncbi:membrane protein insertase YidC [Bradyrhizobium sp. WBOS7]|uniref:Membrane protein insertase YidC n=1 Tax=Bradyrhizobium betae TaxID=244734 RepID=A0AAE9N6P1_9BRAD|nr:MULTISPECIES: membrane protein insertase YidC [Bradyrhizobium]MDD1572732.1 membrane protein insertase YidC [Bradyrhizobium sp. WBOS1]UUO33576.1 membrane protein insertase YidC [Bradyrhizobium sp. WBOS01]MDD1528071.1 membrane protein insertase YidC [Bradyrhizobium sp. WBOS2]MDD1578651.1 membrane protein insertase YidC [Bradyrhizobium sp. WBOS7]MDD1603213.1 membrane protein insertase YidC [Bradyrhizobium sp. WBOS16]
MTDNRNTILAVILSGLVLIAWQYFYNVPQMEKQRAQQQTQAELQKGSTPQPSASATPGGAPATPGSAPQPGAAQPSTPAVNQVQPVVARETAIAASPRVKIETPRIVGSISLKGGRIDDIALVQYRETVDPKSPPIVLYSPSGTAEPYYAEFGWVAATGVTAKMPDAQTVWQQEGSGSLTPSTPVLLKWDNGDGLTFRRTIAVDDHYLFTVKDEVNNVGNAPVTLYPFALISRHGAPQVSGYYILHEGLIGYLGDEKLKEYAYKQVDEAKQVNFNNVTNGWLGITDKYWASALLPDTNARLQARFSSNPVGKVHTYQTDYLLDPVTVAIGGTATANARLFAGAKEAGVVGINFPLAGHGGYNKELGLNHFDLLIDWGWFHFLTKPMFLGLDFFFRFFGNFGISILLVTVIVKLLFFPLANKSYASMAKMKSVQPQLLALKERYPDDKVKQQQEMMEIYRKEKINPVAGCLPVLIQIPVFFALYKVLFVTIEMRHAPFYGWIKDLSAPDPTNLFNLFGLIPFDPTTIPVFGHYLALGIWPIIMGITMWFQMKLNPTPPDPTQQIIFNWMPLIFTFMLAGFPAGLVIYWAWNNLLSVVQQSYIMRRNGVKVELFDNLKATFARKAT